MLDIVGVYAKWDRFEEDRATVLDCILLVFEIQKEKIAERGAGNVVLPNGIALAKIMIAIPRLTPGSA